MEHINLIRSLAWSFHKTTNLEWEELFCEALLAYVRGVMRHNPALSKETTWLHRCITNHLNTYVRKQKGSPEQVPSLEPPDVRTPESLLMFKQMLEGLPTDSKTVCKIIFSTPAKFSINYPKRRLSKILRDLGWSVQRIATSFQEIKKNLRTGV